MAEYVFILSTGRVGSAFLADFFRRQFRDVYAIHEPLRSAPIKYGSNRRLSHVLSEERLLRRLQRYKRYIVDPALCMYGARVYLESTSWFIGCADLLSTVFPSARFIHVVRHPATYIPSHLNRLHVHVWDRVWRRYVPYVRLRGDLTCDYPPHVWQQMCLEERQAWFWVKANMLLEQALADEPQVLCVRYEEVFDADYSGLRQMIRFVGPSQYDAQFPDFQAFPRLNHTRPLFPPASAWSLSLQRRVTQICEPLLKQYVYPPVESLHSSSHLFSPATK